MEGGLKSQFESDWEEVFCDEEEFSDEMTFETAQGEFTTMVTWDQHTLRQRMVVQQQGLWLGDVLLFIGKKWFPVRPKGDEILYVVRKPPEVRQTYKETWKVLDCVDAEDVYEISLDRVAG